MKWIYRISEEIRVPVSNSPLSRKISLKITRMMCLHLQNLRKHPHSQKQKHNWISQKIAVKSLIKKRNTPMILKLPIHLPYKLLSITLNLKILLSFSKVKSLKRKPSKRNRRCLFGKRRLLKKLQQLLLLKRPRKLRTLIPFQA